MQRCHSRPARPAHRALLETCALHRASLHCAASPCGSPNLLSLPAASGQREGSQSACAVLLVACHCLPISRDVEYLLWTDPPSPGCVLQALPRGGQPSATPQLPCSLTQRLRSSLQCPARSSRCCHPPPDPCHTLGQPLCARCGGDPPDLWSPLGSFPESQCLAPDRVARGRCAYVRLGGGNRSRPLPHCGSG